MHAPRFEGKPAPSKAIVRTVGNCSADVLITSGKEIFGGLSPICLLVLTHSIPHCVQLLPKGVGECTEALRMLIVVREAVGIVLLRPHLLVFRKNFIAIKLNGELVGGINAGALSC